MKKKLLVLSVLALSGISTATLASCNRFSGTTTPGAVVSSKDQGVKTVSGISVSGQNTEYGIGDAIVQGAAARVSVNYTDGTSTDGTATASFDFSAVDATKAGTYTVKVTCQGKETSYNVTVKEYVFDGIEVDTTNAKLDYYIYSVYDFSDVVVNSLYKHPVTGEVTKKALNNADVAFNVTDKDGNTVTSQFPAFGTYKVEASYNNAKTSFDVNCVPVDAKTVADAVEAASKAESSINSGTAKFKHYDADLAYEDDSEYVYGENYVMTTRAVSSPDSSGTSYNYQKEKLFYSLGLNGQPFVVAVPVDDDGNATGDPYIPNDLEFNVEAIDAKYAGFNIFKDGIKYNGVYTVVSELYKYLNENIVGDSYDKVGKCEHLDNADGFTFAYNRITTAYNSWVFERVTVEFTLSQSGAINKAYVKVDQYKSEEDPYYGEEKYNSGVAIPSDLPIEIKKKTDEAGLEKKYFEFKADTEATPKNTNEWYFAQESGVKAPAANNPYLASNIAMSSFKLTDSTGRELNDGDIINIDLDNGNVKKDEGNHRFVYDFNVSDVLPTTANSNLDKVSISVSGTGKDGHVVVDSDYSYVFASKYNGALRLTINRPGDYDVVVQSFNVTKILHYHVDYEAPFSIESTIHNGEENGAFVEESTFDMYKSNKIYLAAKIDSAFDPKYTVSVDKESGHLEKTTITVNGKEVECYAFTATEAGTYTVTITGAKPDIDLSNGVSAATNITENSFTIELGQDTYVFTLKNGKLEMKSENLGTISFKNNDSENISDSVSNILQNVLGTWTNENGYELVVTDTTISLTRRSSTKQVTINVAENPTLASILGKYDNKYEATVSDDEIYSLEFTDSDVTVYNKYDHTKFIKYNYTYDADTRKFTLTEDDGDGLEKSFNLVMSNYYELSLVDTELKASYLLTKPTSDITDEDLALLSGTYKGVLTQFNFTYTFKFTPGEEKGTGSLIVTEDQGNGSVNDYEYTYEFDTKTRKLVPTLVVQTRNHPLKSGVVSINNDSNLVFTYAGSDIVLEKQSVDLKNILNAKYTVNANGADYTFEFTVNEDGVTGTLNATRGKRNGTYSWTFDENTNIISLNRTSENDCYVDGFAIENGDVYYLYNATSIKAKCTKDGSAEEPDTPAVSIPESLYGTWYSDDETYDNITISADGLKFDGSTNVAQTVSFNDNILVVKDDYYNEVKFTISATGLTASFYNGVAIVNYTNGSNPEPTEIEISEDYQGTWYGKEDSDYVIVITANSISVNGEEIVVTAADENGISIDSFGTEGVIYFAADGTLTCRIGSNAIELTSDNGDSGDSGETENTIFSQIVGNWTSPSYDDLTITETRITYNWDSADISSATDVTSSSFNINIGGIPYSFVYVDNTITVTSFVLPSPVVFTKGSASGEIDDAILDEYIGSWSTSNGDTLVITSTTVELDCGEPLEGSIVKVDDKSIVFEVTDLMGTVEYELTLNSDGTIVFDEQFVFMKNDEDFEMDDSFIGTWKDDESTITLVIDSSSVKWNDIDATGLAYEDGYLTFNVDGVGTVSAKVNEETGKLEVRAGSNYNEFTKEELDSDSESDSVPVNYMGYWV